MLSDQDLKKQNNENNQNQEENYDFSKCELTGLPTSFFEANRDKYLKLVPKVVKDFEVDSVLVLKGGEEIPRYDTDVVYYHFYQEASFYYLTGVIEPSLNAVVDFKNNTVVLFYDQPAEDTKVWQSVVSVEEMAKKYGLPVYPKCEMYAWLLERNPKYLYKLEGQNDVSGLPVPGFEFKFEEKFKALEEKVKSEPIVYIALNDCRKHKTSHEQRLMKFICDATNKAHVKMMKAIKPGMYERDIENVFNNFSSENYYTRLWGYPCIGGCGCNSATLHYVDNNKKMQDGQLFLADMGMRFCNYVSDVTITIPVNGKFTKKQKEIYDLVLKSNRLTMQMIKPGTSLRDMDRYSKEVILEGLQQLGLIKSEFSVKELYEQRMWYYFYPHALGHYVGIEVHDVNKVSYEENSYLLKEGNVITVEPGIYFRDFLLEKAFNCEKAKYLNIDLIKTYYDFGGVRIEDDILVTSEGFINMNVDLPRLTEDIEKVMSEKEDK